MKRKLLWVGDAVAATGFSRITHEVLKVLAEVWEIHVIGINHWGDPAGEYVEGAFELEFPYPIYPASRGRGDDPFGSKRLGRIATDLKPDVIVVLTDPWHMPRYIKQAGNCPIVGSVMVDGLNCRGFGMNGSAAVIFPTEFGIEQAKLGGYQGAGAVIPLGVDVEVYGPHDRVHARKALAMPPGLYEEGFIVGNVNRNQPRKRLDLTIAYFAEWCREYDHPDAYLHLHVPPTGDQGWDLGQLAQYYGIASKLIYAEPEIYRGCSEATLSMIYSAFDIQITTTQGEGFGLTTLEGMACGIPQIIPQWAALPEICGDAALHVPCPTTYSTPANINAIGGVPDREEFIGCLERLYQEPELRAELGAHGMSVAQQDCYRWRQVGELYGSVIDQAINPVTRFQGLARDGKNNTAGSQRDAAPHPERQGKST